MSKKPGVIYNVDTFLNELERQVRDVPMPLLAEHVLSLAADFRKSIEADKVPAQDPLDADERTFVTALETALKKGTVASKDHDSLTVMTAMGKVRTEFDVDGPRSVVAKITVDGEALDLSHDALAEIKQAHRRAHFARHDGKTVERKAKVRMFAERIAV